MSTIQAPASFSSLGVPGELVEALRQSRITEPFEIQTLTLPDALAGRDILGRAPTGSGKTLAFGLPALAQLAQGPRASGKLPRGLILSPTRELAEQIARELEPLADAVDRRLLAVYGGKGLGSQVKALSRGVDLLIACPGRLLDLISQGAVSLADVTMAVVDEADRMADMGFLPDVRRILDMTNEARQTVLFSATLDNDVQVLIDTYQTDPVQHAVAELEADLSVMEHRFIQVPKVKRLPYLADLIDDTGPTVVFVRTRHGVDRLARQLRQHGVSAGYLHGGRSQSQRDRALQVFTEGKVQALVATDVAARGIHVDGVACVAHYDPPADIKDYVHRSGRTARAGAAGVVVSFLDPGQVRESQKMQRKLGIEAELEDPVESPGRQARLASAKRAPIKPEGTGSPKPKSKARGPKSNSNFEGSTPNRSAKSSPAKPSGRAARHSAPAAGSRAGGTNRVNGGDNPGTVGDRADDGDETATNRSAGNRRKPRSSSRGQRPTGKKRGGVKKRAGSREWAEQSGQKQGSARSESPSKGPKGKRPSGPKQSSGAGSNQTGTKRSGPGPAKAKSAAPKGPKAKSRATKRSGKPRPANRKQSKGRTAK